METSNLTKERISDYLKEGKRFDNRGLLELRDISIQFGISKNAEGSARVKIGKTDVMVGVKLDVMEPFRDSADEGVLITTTELLPMSSDRFESGPPGIEAIEIARLVDRGIRESGFIDFKKLCIKEGEKVWAVMIDIYSINDDGNLIDAACLAAVAALYTAKMPKYDEKKEKVEFGEWTNKSLPLAKFLPITMTFYKINKATILDPIREEEDASDTRLTVCFSYLGKKKVINAIQKGGEGAFDTEDVYKILDLASKEYDILYEKILKMLDASAEKRNE